MTHRFKPITYVTDYRSNASGCGTIVYPNGEQILIQYNLLCPEVLEGLYKKVIHLPVNFNEDYENSHKILMETLNNHEVKRVYDYELGLENGFDYDFNGYLTLNEFDQFRKC